MSKRTIASVFLAALMCINMGTPALAATRNPDPNDLTAAQPRYSHINIFSSGLTIGTGGSASCYASVNLRDSTCTVYLTSELQILQNGRWTTLSTWSSSGKGVFGTSISETASLTKGNTYRNYVTAVVKNSSGTIVETETIYDAKIY